MRRLRAGWKVEAFLLGCTLSVPVLFFAQADPTNAPTSAGANGLSVPAGETLVLELQDSLNTRHTRQGDRVEFIVTNEILAGDRVAITRGSSVHGTVAHAKRPGRLKGRAEIGLHFDELALLDGTTLPLAAHLLRAGWTQTSGKNKDVLKGEGGGGGQVSTIVMQGAQGAIFGAIFRGAKGAAAGGAVGAGMGAVRAILQRGPDLDLPRGMLFEVELEKPLAIPPAAAQKSVQLAANNPRPSSLLSAGTQFPADAAAPDDHPEPPPDFSKADQPGPSAGEATTVAANRTNPTPPAPPPPAADVPDAVDMTGYKIRSDVNLVLVDVTVRDPYGRIMESLKRDDFRLFEDGAEQKLQHFSRDELPLAVALVVDRSGSVAPFFNELRRAAYETLSQLKRGDQVALFAFAATVDRLEDLTTDRQRIAERIAGLRAGGGTNIRDAIYQAANYLRLAAPHRRRAIILISDNQGTVRGFATEHQAITMALEADAVIYSVKTAGLNPPSPLLVPIRLGGFGSVRKMTQETGGEIIEAAREGSLRAALAAVISRLKLRYTLGYPMPERPQAASFRKIDVRLSDRFGHPGKGYSIYARRGYYAARRHVAAQTQGQPNQAPAQH